MEISYHERNEICNCQDRPVKKLPWKKMVLAEDAKGPVLADVARLRVYPIQDSLPRQSPVWLFLRRMEDGQIKYAFSNASVTMPMASLCQAAMMRWPIEQCFQDGKNEVGMDHYEYRSSPVWHRHLTYVFLPLHFLLRLRRQLKKTPMLTLPPAQLLNMAILPCRTLTPAFVLELVKHYTKRNHIAYLAHRKKRLFALAVAKKNNVLR